MNMRWMSVVLPGMLLLAGQIGAQPRPAVGDRVWAQWTPNAWFPGRVGRTAEVGLHIEFDDGDRADRPASLAAVDRAPQADQVKVGSRVLARWTDDRFYPATVTVIDGGSFAVRFDDQDRRTVGLADLRLMAARPTAELTAKPGDRVWAQWAPNAWYPGRVGRTTDVGLHVEFDDGDKADLPVSLVATDRSPGRAAVTIGARVLGLWHDNRYYPGTVTSAADQRYDVAFDDGDSRDGLTLEQLRLLNE